MADPPSATKVPHILGIILITSGVARSQVVAYNRTTGERMAKSTDANKIVVFDASNFTSGYSAGDVISFENVGGSVGGTTITISNATGGFQEADLTAAAAPTVGVNL